MAAVAEVVVVEAVAAVAARHLEGVLVGQRRAVLRDVEGARVERLGVDVHDELREREAVGEGLEPRVGVRVEGEAGADVLVGRAARLAERPVQVLDERHLLLLGERRVDHRHLLQRLLRRRLIRGGAGVDLDRLDLDGRRRLVDGFLVEVGLSSHELVEVRAAELGLVVGLLVLRADLRRRRRWWG